MFSTTSTRCPSVGTRTGGGLGEGQVQPDFVVELGLPELLAGPQRLDHDGQAAPLAQRQQRLVAGAQHCADHGAAEVGGGEGQITRRAGHRRRLRSENV
jgi:hypothetical protein